MAVGDILAYWKHCDTPMCEFWLPYRPGQGDVGDPSYKPVRPCVSAAHLYCLRLDAKPELSGLMGSVVLKEEE